jgi:hypothetical protein
LPRKWFLFINAYESIIFCTHTAHEDSLCEIVGIQAKVWNKLCMTSRDRDVEIWIWFQELIRNKVSLDMFCCFYSSLWIYHVVLITHSGCFFSSLFWTCLFHCSNSPFCIYFNCLFWTILFCCFGSSFWICLVLW